MLKVLVVEDDNLDFERLKGFLDTYSKENNIEFSLERFSSGKDFLNNLSTGYDIAFLDLIRNFYLAKIISKKPIKLNFEKNICYEKFIF